MFTKMAIVDGALANEQFVCAENIGADSNDIAFVLFSELLDLLTSFQKSWYLNASIKTTCLDVMRVS